MIEVKDSLGGKGLFATYLIEPRQQILELKGTVFKKAELPDSPYVIQIGPDLWLGPSGESDDYINHHCDPNCYIDIVSRRAFLYSLHQILPGTELTIDYALGSNTTKEEYCLQCKCGSWQCRKEISGYQYLTAEQKKHYQDLKIVPKYQQHL